ncbi:MAG: GreA/GreB family elongation factor [bacterium]|nr:GreA/GreB family elongation factor [bacterium]
MKKYFTLKGLELVNKKIKKQEEKVKNIGKEMGDAAGISCDWHDNFSYEDAKRRLEMESTILKKLKSLLDGVNIIEIHEQKEAIRIGATAKILFNGEEEEFTIGAFGESDPINGLITYDSPLAHNLMGMKKGDLKNINIAGKDIRIEILEIYPVSFKYYQLIHHLSISEEIIVQ